MLCDECWKAFEVPLTCKDENIVKRWYAGHKVSASWDGLLTTATACFICRLCTIEILKQCPNLPKDCQFTISKGLNVPDQSQHGDPTLSVRAQPIGQKVVAHFLISLLPISAQDGASTLCLA